MERHDRSEQDTARLTVLLQRMAKGHAASRDVLVQALHTQLEQRARRALRGQPAASSVQTHDLVNEAYLKLERLVGKRWKSREHFLAVASSAMRSILVDRARAAQRSAANRDGRPVEEVPGEMRIELEGDPVEVLALHEALEELTRRDITMARAVETRVFGGLGAEETAAAIGISRRTLDRRWGRTMEWLRHRIGQQGEP